MSVAPEFPPDVRIPARARRTAAIRQPAPSRRPVALAVVPAARPRVRGSVRPPVRAARATPIVAASGPAGDGVRVLVREPTVALAPAATEVPTEFVRCAPSVLNRPVWKPAAARQTQAEPASASVRLTARGKVVIGLLAAAIAGILIAIAYAGGGSAGPSPAAAPATVVVHDGDTLWSIARQIAPRADPRAEVATLQRLNHLSGVDLTPGQVLVTRCRPTAARHDGGWDAACRLLRCRSHRSTVAPYM